MFQRKFFRFLSEDASPMALVGLILALSAWWIRFLGMQVGGIGGAMLAIGASGALGLGLLWIITLDQALRLRIRNSLSLSWN
jgi:hypothetical protein